jgi:hypothetical protein
MSKAVFVYFENLNHCPKMRNNQEPRRAIKKMRKPEVEYPKNFFITSNMYIYLYAYIYVYKYIHSIYMVILLLVSVAMDVYMYI